MERHRKASGAVMAMVVGPARLHGPDPFVCGAAVMAGGRWLSHAFDVHFVDAGLLGADRDLEPPADVIVFHALPGIDRERARSLLAEARQVVLAARVGYQARSVIKELCSAQAIPVHDVRDHGAFVLER
jgi:hypothetical protein